MDKLLCFTVSSAFAVILIALPVLAQTPTTVPTPTETAPSPIHVAPMGTGVITGRVVYDGGLPAVNVGVVATIQNDSSLNLLLPYMARTKDKQGRTIFVINGGLPDVVEKTMYVSTVTDADGKYRISGVTSAVYNIIVTAPHHSRWSQVDKPSDWVAVADEGVRAQEGQTISAPDLVLTHGAVIQGQVVEAVTGRPLPGTLIDAYGPERPASSGMSLRAVTDNQGRFSLRVAPGTSTLDVNGVMKANGAVWSLDNQYVAVVDDGVPQKKSRSSPVNRLSVETLAGQAHQVVFRMSRGQLQFRLKAQPKR